MKTLFTERKYLLKLFALILFTHSGCGVYYPQPTDIPLIQKKNDLRIDAGVSIMPTLHTTVSYGITKKIALQTFGSIGSLKNYYFQIAPGLYKDIGNRKVIELYSGTGFGHGYCFFNPTPSHISGNYQLYFLQFNFGKLAESKGYIDWGCGLKSGYFHSNLIDHNFYDRYQPTMDEVIQEITYHDNSILLEPIFFFRVGGDKVKFSYKASVSRIIKITNPDKYIPNTILTMGFGINYKR